MPKSFHKSGFNVEVTPNRVFLCKDEHLEEGSLRFSFGHSESDQLITALGVVAATENLDLVPNEINFGEFVFHFINNKFELLRNDHPYLYPLEFSYTDIDNIQKIIKDTQLLVLNRNENINTRPRC